MMIDTCNCHDHEEGCVDIFKNPTGIYDYNKNEIKAEDLVNGMFIGLLDENENNFYTGVFVGMETDDEGNCYISMVSPELDPIRTNIKLVNVKDGSEQVISISEIWETIADMEPYTVVRIETPKNNNIIPVFRAPDLFDPAAMFIVVPSMEDVIAKTNTMYMNEMFDFDDDEDEDCDEEEETVDNVLLPFTAFAAWVEAVNPTIREFIQKQV